MSEYVEYNEDERVCLACSVQGCDCDSEIITGCSDEEEYYEN